jgi:hypothetical protein
MHQNYMITMIQNFTYEHPRNLNLYEFQAFEINMVSLTFQFNEYYQVDWWKEV